MAGAADLRSYVGANTRRSREQLGISQQAAAELVGVSPRYFRDIEAGRVNLTLVTLGLLARALEVPAHQLLRPAQLVQRGPGRPKAKKPR